MGLNGEIAATFDLVDEKEEDSSPALKFVTDGDDVLEVLEREPIRLVDAYANDLGSDTGRLGAPHVGEAC